MLDATLEAETERDRLGQALMSTVWRNRVSVAEAFSGVRETTVTVTTDASSSCAVELEVGQSYLFFAGGDARSFRIDQCSGTTELEHARETLEVLREFTTGSLRSRLFGSVHRATQGSLVGLPGAKVVARGPGDQVETTTDALGDFRFLGLEPGRYTVTTELSRRFSVANDHMTHVQLDACSAEALILVVYESLVGTVRRRDGLPVADLDVTLVSPDATSPDGVNPAGVTAADGRFSVAGIPPGQYLVGINVFTPPTASQPYPTTWYPGVSDRAGASPVAISDDRVQYVDLILPDPLPTRDIRGVVLARDGRPISGAHVSVTDRQSERAPVATASTDENGRFSLAAVRGRSLTVDASSLLRGQRFESDAIPVPEHDGPITLVVWREPLR